MALNNNPQIVTNGLVCYYDFFNKKSYLGPTIQNLTNSITVITDSSSGFQITSASELVDIPTVGPTNVQIANIRNNYPSVSNNCCPAPFVYFNAGVIAISSSTLYTYAILYRVESNYTHPNFMYRYEYNSNDVYLTESGVHNDSNRVNLGHGWYWAWGTFTSQSTATKLYLYSFYYRYSDSFDKMSVAKILLVQGNYTGLHPRFWPNFGTTRSNTQNILDLTGNNTITASSLTYASDGTFSFNANGNYLSLPNSLGYSSVVSAFAWIKTTGSPKGGYHIVFGGQELEISIPTAGEIRTGIYTNARYVSNHGSGLTNGNWHYVGFTFDGSTKTSYIDGVSVGTQSTSGTLVSSFSGRSIGIYGQNDTLYGMNGLISSASVYNRSLTADEVLQNFNALKGKYGI